MARKAPKRKAANMTAKRSVRRTSQKRNPEQPEGTATELVHRYWRTPRFKKDRAWLEEHLGQQRLFKYNPSTVHVEKIGAKGYGVMIGKQLVGKATPSRADAIRRVSALKATAKKFVKRKSSASPKKAVSSRKRNPVSAKTVTRCKKVLAQNAREKGSEAPPTISYYRKQNPGLHVIHITPGNYGVFVGKYLLKGGFKTKTAADLHLRSIMARKRNPQPAKVAAGVAHEMLRTFDVDHDGELDKTDIAILQHFNDPLVVIDDHNKKAGEIIAETDDGARIVKWSDGKTTSENKSHFAKQNGFKSWRLRRRAARQYRKSLKHSERAANAKRKQSELERKIRNPTNRKTGKEQRYAPVPVQKDLQEFRLELRKLRTEKQISKADINRAFRCGRKAGYSVQEVKAAIRQAYGNRPAGLKKNPGLISALAELAMGTAAAIEVGRHVKNFGEKKRTPANKTAKRHLPNSSQKRPTPKQNSAYSDFQGRESTKVFEIVTPPGTPKRVWILGRLWELRVKGYGTLDLSRGVFYLCSDERNNKLYIGGSRTARITDPVPGMKAGQLLPLGELTHVVYETEKSHLGDAPGDPSPYIHRLGEEGGRRPMLAVDNEGYGYIEGGDYTITPLGIRD
jgi:hypothetical protein